MSNVFGFSTAPSNGGDFVPIVKFDARAGRLFRMDRVETGNGFETQAVDITQSFKAIFDLENLETGWIHFAAGSAPDFKLVRMGEEFPDKPSANHKHGIRFMVKLSKDCAGGFADVREIAGTSKAFVSGVAELYVNYLAAKDKHPDMLPVVELKEVTPVKTGAGSKSSTNFQPTFRIVGWKPRGDLKFVPKATPPAGPASEPESQTPQASAPPSASSPSADAPSEAEEAVAGDFG